MAPTNINLEPDLPIGSIATPEDIYFLVDNLQGAPISNAMTLETLQAAAGGTTNLSIGTIDPIANTIEILSSTGTPAVLEQASDLVPGLMSIEDWTKLAGLGAGPTINVDDYASVQLALDAIPVTGARVVFPQPEYLVHTLDIDQKNNVVLDLCGTVLKAPDAASTDTGNWGLRIRRCNRVLVQNGTIDGNRANRTPQDPTNPSYNLYIRGGAHIKVAQLHTINSVSDGVYIRAEDDFTRSTFPTDLLFENLVADNNFRQGVSCITSNGVVMIGGALINTNGADPGAGWQVEPSEAGGAEPGNSNVTLIGVRIEGNSGFGAGSVAPKDFRGLHIAGCHFGQNGKGAIENGSPATILGNLFKAITSAESGSVIRSNSTGQSGSTRIIGNHFEDIDAFDPTNPIAECVYSADQGRLVMTGNTAVNTPALASAWGDDSDISHNVVEGCVVPAAAISLRGARSKANYNQLSNCKENVIRVQLAEGETGQVIGNDIWDCNQVLQTSYGLIRIVEGAIDVFDNNLNRSDGQPTWRGIRVAGNNVCRVQRNRIKNLDAAPIFDETSVAIVRDNLIDDLLYEGETDRENVRNHGAVGDGIVDDLAAINAAINAANGAKSVFFPPGIYLTSAELSLVIAGTELCGAFATLRTTAGSMIQTKAANITISGLILDGENTLRLGIWAVDPSPNLMIVNNEIKNLNSPTGAAGSEAILIQQGCDGAVVQRNHIHDVSGENPVTPLDPQSARGIRLAEAAAGIQDIRIVDNLIEDIFPAHDGDGIVIQDWTSDPTVLIQGNVIRRCSKRAIKIQRGGVTVVGNDLQVSNVVGGGDLNPRAVVTVVGSNVNISGNKLAAPDGCTNAVFDLDSGTYDNVTISGNNIYVPTGHGNAAMDVFDLAGNVTSLTIGNNASSAECRDGVRMNGTLQSATLSGNTLQQVTRHILHFEAGDPALQDIAVVANTWANCTGANFINASSTLTITEGNNTGDDSIASKYAGGWNPAQSDATVEVIGSGVPATDEAAFAGAIATLEGLGGGLIRITGDPTNNQFFTTGAHTYLSSISLEGTGQGVRFMMQQASSHKMTWGNFNPDTATTYSTSCAAGEQDFGSPGLVLTEGQWVCLFSENQVDVHPHSGFGTGQHSMELKQVHYFDNTGMKGYTDSSFVDSHGARARYAVVPMIKDVRISNITFEWDGAGELVDYAQALRFEAVHGLTLDRSVRFARNGPGAIWLGCVADGRIDCTIDGSDKIDGVYGIVASCTNGVIIDAIIRGTRHAFTTTAMVSVNQQITVDSVEIDPTNTLTAAGHGLVNNMHVSFTTTGTLPAGLAPATNYWVVNATTDTIQVALAPSGAPITLADAGFGTHTIQRVGRWGTPQNIIDRSLIYCPSKISDGPVINERVAWSPHAEGARITFSGEIVMTGEDGNTAMVIRSRYTTVQNAIIRGSDTVAFTLASAIRIKAKGCRVRNTSLADLWWGIQVGDTDVAPIADTILEHVSFNRMSAPPIYLFAAEGVTVSHCTPVDCGTDQGSVPFYRKSLIYVRQRCTDVRIINCGLAKSDNDYSIVTQVDPGELTIVGNTLTGYGAADGGFGRSMTVSNVDVGNDELDMSGTHGWDTNDLVRVSTTGTLPSGIAPATDYRVIDTGAATVQLSLTIDGPPIPIADAGSGTHTLTDSAAVIRDPVGTNWVDP